MSKQPFVVGPSRKPEFWAAVEGRAPKEKPAPAKKVPVKKAAKKKTKKGGKK